MLRFRADRVDRDDGALRLTDYKTGRPFARQQGERYRTARHLGDTGRGLRLQAVAYALAGAAAGGGAAEGRYAYLHPEGPEHARVFTVLAGDEDFTEQFAGAVAAVTELRERGSFFPRLVEPERDEEPYRCSLCEVKAACLRGDTGARLQLSEWAVAARERKDELEPAERSLLRLYDLGADVS